MLHEFEFKTHSVDHLLFISAGYPQKNQYLYCSVLFFLPKAIDSLDSPKICFQLSQQISIQSILLKRYFSHVYIYIKNNKI